MRPSGAAAEAARSDARHDIAGPQAQQPRRRRFRAGAVHNLSVKEYGPEEGSPALFLHGGPGSGCRAALCRLFPPGRFRIIAPDQRGAGESTPKGRLEENTTQHHVSYIHDRPS